MCGEVHGTGFFIDEDIIATNYHVIESHDRYGIKIKQATSSKEFNGRLLTFNGKRDLALIRVANLKSSPLDLAKECRQGDEVIVIGNPEEFEFSVAKGIVSAIRPEEGVTYIQTDAAINHGNSGGPIINKDGKVVGIATMIIRRNHAEGLGFGVSANHLKELRNKESGHWDARAIYTVIVIVFLILLGFFLGKAVITGKKRKEFSLKELSLIKRIKKSLKLLEKGQVSQARVSLKIVRNNLAEKIADIQKITDLVAIQGDLKPIETLNISVRQLDQAISSLDKQLHEEAQQFLKAALNHLKRDDKLPDFLKESRELAEILEKITQLVKSRSFYEIPLFCKKLRSLRTGQSFLLGWLEEIEDKMRNELEKADKFINKARYDLDERNLPQLACDHAGEALRIVSNHPEADNIRQRAEARAMGAKKLLSDAEKCLYEDKYTKLKLAIKKAKAAASFDRSLNERAEELIDIAKNKIKRKKKRFRRVFAVAAALSSTFIIILYISVQSWNSWQEYQKMKMIVERTPSMTIKIRILKDYASSHKPSKYTKLSTERIEALQKEIEVRDYKALLEKTMMPDLHGRFHEQESLHKAFLNEHPNSSYTKVIEEKIQRIQNQIDDRDYDELKQMTRRNYLIRLNAYNEYIADHPEGKYPDRVGRMILDMQEEYYQDFKKKLNVYDKNKDWDLCAEVYNKALRILDGNEHYAEVRDLQKDFRKRMKWLKTLSTLQYLEERAGTNYEAAKYVYTAYLEANNDLDLFMKRKITKEIDSLDKKLQEKREWGKTVAYVKNGQKRISQKIDKLKKYIKQNPNGLYEGEAKITLKRLEKEKRLIVQQKRKERAEREWKKIITICNDGQISVGDKIRRLKVYIRKSSRKEYVKKAHNRLELLELLHREEERIGKQVKSSGGIYIENGDGTITDIRTDLIWTTLDSYSESFGMAGFDYNSAKIYVKDLRTGSYRDWRLPTPEELVYVYKNTPFFPSTGAVWYWTSLNYGKTVAIVTTERENNWIRGEIEAYVLGSVRAVRP